ncbi:MAG: tRNA pseudouridine(13) synthase TruD [Pseudomonadota bacterium]
MELKDSWHKLSHAWGGPLLRGRFKSTPEDFRVEENLGFVPDGAGEHLWLFIEKTGLSTFESQSILARHFNVALRDTAFSGMKDRQGITRQWFSLHLKNFTDEKVTQFQHPQLKILQSAANSRKLRRGSHRSNKFCIVLRDVSGEKGESLQLLDKINSGGVPNYFGSQRFGNADDNANKAMHWFQGKVKIADRNEKSLLLSAARSFLFNVLLDERVKAASWNTSIDGDVMALAGSGSVFASGRATPEELGKRLEEFDIHPTGPLWGKGALATAGVSALLEQTIVHKFPELAAGLEKYGLTQERRPLRLRVNELQVSFEEKTLQLEFSLDRGTYATSVLRELIVMENT